MANVTVLVGESYGSGDYSRTLYGTDSQVPGAVAAVGGETTSTEIRLPVTGVSASTFIGSTTDSIIVDITAGATVSVTGLSATLGAVGLFTVWGDLATSDTTPTTTWTDIAA